MKANEVNVGQWVWFQVNGGTNVFTGFVIRKHIESARVVVPTVKQFFEVPYVLLHKAESVTFKMDDMQSMIDIALDTNDREWFEELVEMKGVLELWQ